MTFANGAVIASSADIQLPLMPTDPTLEMPFPPTLVKSDSIFVEDFWVKNIITKYAH